jgi:hypothetical protein
MNLFNAPSLLPVTAFATRAGPQNVVFAGAENTTSSHGFQNLNAVAVNAQGNLFISDQILWVLKVQPNPKKVSAQRLRIALHTAPLFGLYEPPVRLPMAAAEDGIA